jgi:chitinase
MPVGVLAIITSTRVSEPTPCPVLTVFSYLNYPDVWQRLKTTNALIRQELEIAQEAYNDSTGSQTKILDCWDQWLADHLAKVVQHGID